MEDLRHLLGHFTYGAGRGFLSCSPGC
jgi:hypothetical protein